MATKAAKRWTKIIDEQEASGLTIAEFARRNNIKSGSLSWWRSTLGRTRKRTTNAAFLELVIEEQEPVSVGITVRLPSRGVELVVDEATSLGLVRKLVEALC